jgi:hypothetical protein
MQNRRTELGERSFRFWKNGQSYVLVEFSKKAT